MLVAVWLVLTLVSQMKMVNSAESTILDKLRDMTLPPGSTFKFDILVSVPIPLLGDIKASFDVKYGYNFKYQGGNSSTEPNPITIPFEIVPEFDPAIFQNPSINDSMAWDLFSYLDNSESPYFQQQPESRSFKRRKGGKRRKNKFRQHRRYARSLSPEPAKHRSRIFNLLTRILDQHGLNGADCIKRAICEMAQMDLLIESPWHEIFQNLFRISNIYDPEKLLQEFLEAENYGIESKRKSQWNDECFKHFRKCPISIFQR